MPAHTANVVVYFLADKRILVLSPPILYSHGLTPPDYFLFPKLKLELKGNPLFHYFRYSNICDEQIKVHSEGVFASHDKIRSPIRQCIDQTGAYFE